MTKTKIKTEPRYKWGSPLEWLDEKILATDDVEELRQLARACAEQLDSDQLQEYFQSDMDADGFFQDLNKRAFYCEGCEQFHRVGWDGDCRDDSERMATLPTGWEEVEEDTE